GEFLGLFLQNTVSQSTKLEVKLFAYLFDFLFLLGYFFLLRLIISSRAFQGALRVKVFGTQPLKVCAPLLALGLNGTLHARLLVGVASCLLLHTRQLQGELLALAAQGGQLLPLFGRLVPFDQ